MEESATEKLDAAIKDAFGEGKKTALRFDPEQNAELINNIRAACPIAECYDILWVR